MSLSVVLLQMDIAFGKPEENRARVEKLLHEAIQKNPDVVVLPELWTTGYDLERLDEIAEGEQRETEKFLSNLAKQYHIHFVAGSIAKKCEKGIANTLIVFNRDGEKVFEYSKAHLFRLMDEEKYFVAGSKKGLFQLDEIDCGGLICYDIRFPEWIRAHVLAGVTILFIPAQWPSERIDHWQTLLRARAIENQCFIIACNRAGSDPNNTFGGHSLIIGPWGEILAEAGTEQEIIHAELDINQVQKIRNTIPIFEDRREELY